MTTTRGVLVATGCGVFVAVRITTGAEVGTTTPGSEPHEAVNRSKKRMIAGEMRKRVNKRMPLCGSADSAFADHA